ncbi:conserved membrane hypothetical protein [Alphaproteobacteria bacterium]
MSIFIKFIHVVPLFLIALSLSIPYVYRKVTKQDIAIAWLTPVVLLLCAVGITAGTNSHHGVRYLVDPCFGYAAALIYIALRSLNTTLKMSKVH